MNELPVSTKLTLDAAGDTGREAIQNVFLIYSKRTGQKGTGFLAHDGYIITNRHVIEGSELQDLEVIDVSQQGVALGDAKIHKHVDLAALLPANGLSGGLQITDSGEIPVGTTVLTWGHPLGYNGPNPLLSVGHISGFRSEGEGLGAHTRLVVNGAFNPGNSGGPLFRSNSKEVIGVVVSKHAPFTQFQLQALEAMANNKGTGVGYTYTRPDGSSETIMEAQIVADMLAHFRSLTQVMIGEAISAEALRGFLAELQR